MFKDNRASWDPFISGIVPAAHEEHVSGEYPGEKSYDEKYIQPFALVSEYVSVNLSDIEKSITVIRSNQNERAVVLEVREVAEYNREYSCEVMDEQLPVVLLSPHHYSMINHA